MATPKLPSTNSIIDYLNAQGQSSSFSSRSKLYKDSGLQSRLGNYVGGANQNLALLDYLRNGSTSASAPTTSKTLRDYSIEWAQGNPSNPTANTPAPSFYQGNPPPNAQEGQQINGTPSADLVALSKRLAENQANMPENLRYGAGTTTANSTPQTNEGGGLSGFMNNLFGETYGYQRNEDGYTTTYEPSAVQGFFGAEPTSERITTSGDKLAIGEEGVASINEFNQMLEDGTVSSLEEYRALKAGGGTQTPTGGGTGGAGGGTTTQQQFDTSDIERMQQEFPELGQINEQIAQYKRFGMEVPQSLIQRRNKFIADQISRISGEVSDIQTRIDDMRARDQQTREEVGAGATDIVGEDAGVPELELVDEWLNTTEGKLALEKYQLGNQQAEQAAEVAKEALETKYAQEKTSLEDKLAARGLAFSGIRATEVKALADSLAASQLNVDRTFANKLLDADIRFRETVLAGVADLISAANDQQEDAIKQLNLMGYAVVGGELMPTLSLQREMRIADTPEVTIQTNSAGQVSAIDKATGETIWRTEAGVGRSGSASPNLSVSPIADPVTGQATYVQIINRDTGEIEYRDATTGEQVTPDQVTIGDAADPLDMYIDSIVGEMLGDLQL